jgi:hypothetical protein
MIYANDRVRSVEQLTYLVDQKKAVTVPGTNFSGPLPAAFMINLPGAVIMRLIRRGMYLYTSKKEGSNHPGQSHYPNPNEVQGDYRPGASSPSHTREGPAPCLNSDL